MRRLTTMLCVAAAGAVAVVPGAATADDGCNGNVVEIPGFGYIDDRSETAPFWDGGGTWVYHESNGTPGLQSGGVALTGEDLGGKDDCAHANPDTAIL